MRFKRMMMGFALAMLLTGITGCGNHQAPKLDSEQVKAKLIHKYQERNRYDGARVKTVKITLHDIRPVSIQHEIRKAIAEAILRVQIGDSIFKEYIKYSAQYNTDGELCVDILKERDL